MAAQPGQGVRRHREGRSRQADGRIQSRESVVAAGKCFLHKDAAARVRDDRTKTVSQLGAGTGRSRTGVLESADARRSTRVVANELQKLMDRGIAASAKS